MSSEQIEQKLPDDLDLDPGDKQAKAEKDMVKEGAEYTPTEEGEMQFHATDLQKEKALEEMEKELDK